MVIQGTEWVPRSELDAVVKYVSILQRQADEMNNRLDTLDKMLEQSSKQEQDWESRFGCG